MRSLLLICALVAATAALRSQRYTRLDSHENFQQISDVTQNPAGFYYYLRFSQNFEQYAYFCSQLLQELENQHTIHGLYFTLKVIKELQCKLQPQGLLSHVRRVKDRENHVSEASHLFRMLIMTQAPLNEVLDDGCKRFTKYIFSDSAKVRRSDELPQATFDHTAQALRDLWECGVIAPDFKNFTTKMAAQAVKGLVDITKHQSAWPSEDTLYDTMDITIALMHIDSTLLSRDKLDRIITFVASNVGNDMSLREKNKWNQFLGLLDERKIQILEAPLVFDFNGCEDTCYLPIVGLPNDSRVTTHWEGRDRNLKVQKTNILMSDNDDMMQANQLVLSVSNSDWHLVPSKFTVKIRRDNAVGLIRMAVNSQAQISDLIDSDESECSSIGLNGNEGSFLHVGFRLKNEEHFAFVHLEPHISEFENSAMVHAEYRPDEKMYVASLDFSDYETIRPNSGTYNIWLTFGGQKRQCGQITLSFTNLEKSFKDSLTKAAPVELTNVPTFKMDDERFYFAGLYFTIAAGIFAIAYWAMFARVTSGLEEECTSPFWQTVFLAALAGHIATLFLLLLRYQLIDKAYIPLLQLGGLSYLFARAFLRRG